jgi:hypothetical protein
MRVKDLEDVASGGPEPDASAGDALADVPVAAPKGRGPAVERIGDHGALLDGPAAEDGEPGAEAAAVVKLAIGQDEARLAAHGRVVGLREELLQADDVGRLLLLLLLRRRQRRRCQLAPNLRDALAPEG